MPRDHSTLPDPPVDRAGLPEYLIPDLTYENAAELLVEADYVMLSFNIASPPDEFALDEHGVTVDRVKTMWSVFYEQFSDQLAPDAHYGRTKSGGETRHIKLIPDTESLFEDLETFFADMVPLWSWFALSFCWRNHAYPKASTLVYQLDDDLPPFPGTTPFKNEYGFRSGDIDHMDDEEKIIEHAEIMHEAREAQWAYEDSAENPRFEYGPTHVINGDYGCGGTDVMLYCREELHMDVRFAYSNDEDDDPYLFLDTSGHPFIEVLREPLSNYPEHISVTEVNGETTTITAENAPKSGKQSDEDSTEWFT